MICLRLLRTSSCIGMNLHTMSCTDQTAHKDSLIRDIVPCKNQIIPGKAHILGFNTCLASSDFIRLHIIFANSLDPYQDQPTDCPS